MEFLGIFLIADFPKHIVCKHTNIANHRGITEVPEEGVSIQCQRRQTHRGDRVTIQMLTNTFAGEVETQRGGGGGGVVQAETNFEWDVVDRRDSGIWRL